MHDLPDPRLPDPDLPAPGRSAAGQAADVDSEDYLADDGRLAALSRLDLFADVEDGDLQAVALSVALGCRMPMAFVSTVTADSVRFPGSVGLPAECDQVPVEVSLGAQVVRTRREVHVDDAPSHPVYRDHPLVRQGVVGSCVGVPLWHAGHVVGTVAVCDAAPSRLTEEQRQLLLAQSRLAGAVLTLRSASAWDALTGLASRTVLLDAVRRSLARSRPGRGRTALLALDVQGMADFNHRYGFAAGDELLRTVATRLVAATGSGAGPGRLGGDRFGVLLEDLSSPQEAEQRAKALAAAVEGPVEGAATASEPANRWRVSVHWGLSSSLSADADELVLSAERALTQSRVRRARPGGAPADPVVPALRAAITDDQLRLHYQPLVELGTGRVTGAEALVRWQHPTRGLLAPTEFVPVAEAAGLMPQLGRWVLDRAAADLGQWRRDGLDLEIAVNLSPFQLAPGLAVDVVSVLAARSVPADRLVLEVTETSGMDEPSVPQTLAALRAAGIRLALDDFGTGYASFAYLRRFPIDIIKIDRSFVAGLGVHRQDDEIVASVVRLAKRTRKTVIAEGVETASQVAALQGLGVDRGQGFLWTRALPAQEFVRWVRAASEREVPAPRASSQTAGSPAADTPVQSRLLRARRRPGSPSHQETAHVVARIAELHAAGSSLHTIAACLNSEGLRTSKGVRWHVQSVASVLAAERVAG